LFGPCFCLLLLLPCVLYYTDGDDLDEDDETTIELIGTTVELVTDANVIDVLPV
jgi:hypothetical protein